VSSILKKHRGLSASNPYLQPTPMTYVQEVQPYAIAEQLMATALLIAHEWRTDLPALIAEEDELWARRTDQVTGFDESANRFPAFSLDQDSNSDSPYRAGNFDLIKAFATRQAAQAVARDLSLLPSRAAEARMLSGLLPRFEGELPLGAADTFLAALLDQPLVLIAGAKDEAPTFTDPRSVAQEVLLARRDLASEWAQQLGTCSNEFLAIKKEWLDIVAEC